MQGDHASLTPPGGRTSAEGPEGFAPRLPSRLWGCPRGQCPPSHWPSSDRFQGDSRLEQSGCYHHCVDENIERRNHYLDLAGIENYTSQFGPGKAG